MPKHLILIGMMGSGKTSVGRRLSEISSLKFVDMDSDIESQEGLSVKEIFSSFSEDYFRNLETHFLQKLMGVSSSIVLSTGGGVILSEQNRSLLKQLGRVYFLSASVDTLYKRVSKSDARPLLQVSDSYKALESLFLSRKAFYESVSDVIVSVEDQSPESVSTAIWSDFLAFTKKR